MSADAMTDVKWVYAFGGGDSQGEAGMRTLLGGKGANLAEMAKLGLPVPPGFTLTTAKSVTPFTQTGGKYPGEPRTDRSKTALSAGLRVRSTRNSATRPIRFWSRFAPVPVPPCRA